MLEGVPKHDQLIVMSDWNAKVGQAEKGEEKTNGKYPLRGGGGGERGLGMATENGLSICAMNDLLITSTVFQATQRFTQIHLDVTDSKFKN